MDKWLIKSGSDKSQIDVNNKIVVAESVEPTSSQSSMSYLEPASKKTKLLCTGKHRKYNCEYLKFGFISSGENEEKPLCVICLKTLSNDAMRPGKLSRHLNTVHSEFKNKTIDFFERKARDLKRQTNFFPKYTKLNDKLLKASFEIALLVAKTKKSHTIGEDLVLPAAIKICEMIHGSEIADPLKKIPISNDTIKKRVDCIAENIKETLLLCIKQSRKFAIQLDESTDNTNIVNLIVFIKYPYDSQLHEDMLICRNLSGTTKGVDIFNTVNDFFSKNELEWEKCVGVCTDGAAAMTGKISGFISEVKKGCPNANMCIALFTEKI